MGVIGEARPPTQLVNHELLATVASQAALHTIPLIYQKDPSRGESHECSCAELAHN